MKGSEFLRKLRRLARQRQQGVLYDAAVGKGSHGRVWLGAKSTILKDPKKELGIGLIRSMCEDLGIDLNNL